MALDLSFEICFNKCCKSLRLTDTTGAGTPGDGSGDWNDTVSYTDVAAAYLYIYYPGTDHNTEDPDEEIDLYAPSTSPLKSAITGTSFVYDDINGTWADGMYTFEYLVIDNSSNEYTTLIKSFNYCNTRHCLDGLAEDVASEFCDVCDIDDEIEDYLNAEALLAALISAVNCLNETAMNNLLQKIQDLCEFEDCEDCN